MEIFPVLSVLSVIDVCMMDRSMPLMIDLINVQVTQHICPQIQIISYHLLKNLHRFVSCFNLLSPCKAEDAQICFGLLHEN